MVTGKFDFESMVIASPLLGPVVFFVFVLCTSIILVNIFLTLIISAFETVKHDVMKQDNEYEIIDFILAKLKTLLGITTFPDFFDDTDLDEREKQAKLIEEQIESLPMKVEQLKSYVKKKNYRHRHNSAAGNHQLKMVIDNDNNLEANGSKKLIQLDANDLQKRDSIESLRNQRNRRNGRRSLKTTTVGLMTTGIISKTKFLDWNEVQD
ncbi:guanine nucleotide-binding protein subunit alpha-like [Sarcoptes scabiei]|nr:guanine nucleotide-binding protein subunit alpha-like [Sarcoptes scabiei]